jgi:hypothetical protein
MKNISALLISFILLGCNENTTTNSETTTTIKTTSTEDSAIKKEIRDEIATLNNTVIDAIINNNISGLDPLKSPNLESQEKSEFEKAFAYINDQLITKPQSNFKEFYAKSTNEKIENTLKNKFEIGKTIDSIFFDIKYTSPQKESYLTIHRMSTDFCERLLTLIYGKYGNEWKLDYMAVGVFKINGLTSPEHLEAAKTFKAEGELVQALTSVFAAQTSSAPIYELLTYENQEEIKEVSDNIIEEFNEKYPLPLDLNSTGIKGEILGLTLAPTKDGKYHPLITYRTSINLNDMPAVEKENIKLHSKIETLLPGIKAGFDGIIYRLYNESPEQNPEATTYNLYRVNNG